MLTTDLLASINNTHAIIDTINYNVMLIYSYYVSNILPILDLLHTQTSKKAIVMTLKPLR